MLPKKMFREQYLSFSHDSFHLITIEKLILANRNTHYTHIKMELPNFSYWDYFEISEQLVASITSVNFFHFLLFYGNAYSSTTVFTKKSALFVQ